MQVIMQCMLEKAYNDFVKVSLHFSYLLIYGNSHEVCREEGAVWGFLHKGKRKKSMKKKGLVIIRIGSKKEVKAGFA